MVQHWTSLQDERDRDNAIITALYRGVALKGTALRRDNGSTWTPNKLNIILLFFTIDGSSFSYGNDGTAATTAAEQDIII